MNKANFSDDFKQDAVAQITERSYPVREVSEREHAFALRVEEEVFTTIRGR